MTNVIKKKREDGECIILGSKHNDKVKPKIFIEWGRIGFVANKRTKTAKMDKNRTPMMMSGHALDRPSITCRMHNPGTVRLVNTSSVRWSKFTP